MRGKLPHGSFVVMQTGRNDPVSAAESDGNNAEGNDGGHGDAAQPLPFLQKEDAEQRSEHGSDLADGGTSEASGASFMANRNSR